MRELLQGVTRQDSLNDFQYKNINLLRNLGKKVDEMRHRCVKIRLIIVELKKKLQGTQMRSGKYLALNFERG